MNQPARLFVSSDDRAPGTRPSNFTVYFPAGVEGATDVLIESCSIPAYFYSLGPRTSQLPMLLRDASGNDTFVSIPLTTNRYFVDDAALAQSVNSDIQIYAAAHGGLAGDVSLMADSYSRKLWLQRSTLGVRLVGYADPLSVNSAWFKLGFTNVLTPDTPQLAREAEGFPDRTGTRNIFLVCSIAGSESLTSQSVGQTSILARIPNSATDFGESILYAQVLPSQSKPTPRSFNSIAFQLLDDDGFELVLPQNAVVALTLQLAYRREEPTKVF